MNIAIIGAGASALFLQALLKNKYDITIFERNKKIASKLLASGNGRCNLLNINASSNDYNNKGFMDKVFSKVNTMDILKIFNKLGLTTTIDEEGRVYPISLSSETVLNILTDKMNAKVELNYIVKSIKKVGDKYQINDYKTLFDYCVLASGSSAAIIEEKQNLCYDYLKLFNLSPKSINPSLVGFKIKNSLKGLFGVRCKALCKLYVDNMLIHEERGEVIFKEDGISGIVIMNMSSYYNRTNKNRSYITLDILEGINPNNLKGALNPKMYLYVIENRIDIHSFRLDIVDTYGIKDSQVINGGIDVSNISDTFRLNNDKNIFLMGEMLDIDGICGGYNLSFAFMSAYIVGSELGYENKD